MHHAIKDFSMEVLLWHSIGSSRVHTLGLKIIIELFITMDLRNIIIFLLFPRGVIPSNIKNFYLQQFIFLFNCFISFFSNI